MRIHTWITLLVTTFTLLTGCATSSNEDDLPSINNKPNLQEQQQAKLEAATRY